MTGTAALGLAFLVMHGFEYHKEYSEHLIPGLNFSRQGSEAPAVECALGGHRHVQVRSAQFRLEYCHLDRQDAARHGHFYA